jgi:uncharacterized protein (DUF433 family)
LYDRIAFNPAILGGKPIIKGTRIPVELILKMLAQDIAYDEILREYPDLAREDILAALAYAQDTVAAEEVTHAEMAVA